MLLSIFYKIKKQQKKSQRIDTKTCQKKKNTRLKSTKKKISATDSVQKKKHHKINDFCFCSV